MNKLLRELAPPAVANARKEAADMQEVIKQEGGNFPLESWDWSFYAEKVQKARYAFDESQVKPYFELNHVQQDGVFYAAGKVYGLTFKERKDLPVYQEDVRVFEVYEPNGQPLALFICRHVCAPLKTRRRLDERIRFAERHLRHQASGRQSSQHSQAARGRADAADLRRSDDDVSRIRPRASRDVFECEVSALFSGTNVPRDFVEFPSQVNEMWAIWPEIVKNYAKHYQTGEPMPKELLDKMLAARKFNQGFTTTEYLAATLLDQAWHQLKPNEIPKDALAFEAEALKKAGVDLPHGAAALSHRLFFARLRRRLLRGILLLHLERSARCRHGAMDQAERRNDARERRSLSPHAALARWQRRCASQQFKNFTGGGTGCRAAP